MWGWAYGSNTVVYDGSEDEAWKWQGLNGYGIVNLQINLSGAVSNFDSPNRCSHLPYQTTGIAATTEPGFFISDSTGNSILYIRVPNADVWDVPSFRRWLAKYVITVQYQTDTETWVPLSPEEQAAMNALCTYAGITHIWTDDPLQPVISLDYTVDTAKYIGALEDRIVALEANQAQTTAAFGYLPANIQAEMIENETNQLMDSI